MRGRVLRFHSPDAEVLSRYLPADPLDFGLLVQIIVGPSDGPNEESFEVVVCSPAWVARRVVESGPLIRRHHLVVERYDWKRISDFLMARIESVYADDWTSLAEKIGRIGCWEFEDYTP